MSITNYFIIILSLHTLTAGVDTATIIRSPKVAIAWTDTVFFECVVDNIGSCNEVFWCLHRILPLDQIISNGVEPYQCIHASQPFEDIDTTRLEPFKGPLLWKKSRGKYSMEVYHGKEVSSVLYVLRIDNVTKDDGELRFRFRCTTEDEYDSDLVTDWVQIYFPN